MSHSTDTLHTNRYGMELTVNEDITQPGKCDIHSRFRPIECQRKKKHRNSLTERKLDCVTLILLLRKLSQVQFPNGPFEPNWRNT